MKKIVAILLAVLMLCTCFACAEESSFTFRNGLYWGMSPEEVLAAEGRSAFDVEYINRSQGTSQCLLQNVSIGSFQAEIVFNFLEERLISAAIVPEATDAATLEQMMYLVYGQPDTGAITREDVTAVWQLAPNACVCVVEDMTDGLYLCYFDADMGLPTALYGAVPTATPAPKYETNKPIVTPTPTAKPTPAPVTSAPTATPTCEPAEDTEIYLETPTPTPTCEPAEDTEIYLETPTPAPTCTPKNDMELDEDIVPVVTNTPVVTPGPGGGGEWGGSFATDTVPNQPETTYIPEGGEGDNVDFGPTPTPPCETNVPLDREESTEAPSTDHEDGDVEDDGFGWDNDDGFTDDAENDFSGSEIGGDDCEPNEDTDIFLDP